MCFWVAVLSGKNLKMCETYLLPRLTICIFQWLLSHKNIICQDHLAQLTHFTEKWSTAVILNLECVSESHGGLWLTKNIWVSFIMFHSLVVQRGGGPRILIWSNFSNVTEAADLGNEFWDQQTGLENNSELPLVLSSNQP